MRLSQTALKVLKMFVENSGKSFSGADIAKVTGAGSGTLYPLLARFEAMGWAISEWEEVDPRQAGRPRKRLYRLTIQGRTKAHTALADLQVPAAVGGLLWIA